MDHAEMVKRSGSEQPVRPPGRPAKRPPGRPFQEWTAEIDRKILDVAQTFFLTRGFAGTKMDAIIAAAGISSGTLYSRYANKSELFEAIARDRLEAWSIVAPGPGLREKSLEKRLLKRAANILDSLSSPEVRSFEKLLSEEAARFPELSREFYERGFLLFTRHVAEDIAAALGGGAAAETEGATAASIFAGALIGWFRVESAVRRVPKAERDRFARQITAFTLKGLGLA